MNCCEQENGANSRMFWLAGYVILLFLIGAEQRAAECSILARKIRHNPRWSYYNIRGLRDS